MTPDLRLAQVLVDLSDTLVDDFDVVTFLGRLADRNVELLGSDAAGLALADRRGHLRAVASSAGSGDLAGFLELQAPHGPSLDCFRSGEQVVNVAEADLQARWPEYWGVARHLGLRSAQAFPMRLRDEVIGAVTLVGRGVDPLSDDDITAAQVMADVATIGLLQQRSVHHSVLRAQQLTTAMSSRVVIEQAKGTLAERAALDVDEAFALMRSYARRSGLSVTATATAVLAGSLSADDLRR